MGDLEEGFGAGQRILRLVTVSHRCATVPPPDRAHDLALRGQEAGLTGALVALPGGWLHWIEGPGAAVCAQAPALARAPWQAGARLVAIGWRDRRRFARWPMRLTDLTGQADLTGLADLPEAGVIPRAARIFDALAQDHARGEAPLADLLRQAADFCAGLAGEATDLALPALARDDLHARAGFVEAILYRLGLLHAAGQIGSTDVTLALTRLNGMVQRAGRPSQPMRPRGRVCLVIPPGETEVIGTILKADLLRDAGLTVRVVIETTSQDIGAVLRREEKASAIVTGPRLEAGPGNGRAERLWAELRQSFPDRLILPGGAASGPLAEAAERLALHRHRAGLVAVETVDWASLGALAKMIAAPPQAVAHGVFC